MAKVNKGTAKSTTSAPKAPAQAPVSKTAKSTTEAVMLLNVLHDGVLYAQGERVTLDEEVLSLFVSKGHATAVEVADSGSKPDSDPESQKADAQAGAPTNPDAGDAPTTDAPVTDGAGAEAKPEENQTPSNS